MDINPTEPGKYTFEVVATGVNKPKNKATYQFTTIVNINVKGLENYTAGIRHGDPVATYNLSAEVLPATLSQEITWSVTSDQELDDVIKIDNNNQLVITPNTSSTETAKNYHFFLESKTKFSSSIVVKKELNLTVGNIEIIDSENPGNLICNDGIKEAQLEAKVYPETASQNVTWSLDYASIENIVALSPTGKITIDTSVAESWDTDIMLIITATSDTGMKAIHYHSIHIYTPVISFNMIDAQFSYYDVKAAKTVNAKTTNWNDVYRWAMGYPYASKHICPSDQVIAGNEYLSGAYVTQNNWVQFGLSWVNDGGVLSEDDAWHFSFEVVKEERKNWTEPTLALYNQSKNTVFFHFVFDETTDWHKELINDVWSVFWDFKFIATNDTHTGIRKTYSSSYKASFYYQYPTA